MSDRPIPERWRERCAQENHFPLRECAEELAAAEKECEALRADLKNSRTWTLTRARIAALQAQNQDLREALERFAKSHHTWCPYITDFPYHSKRCICGKAEVDAALKVRPMMASGTGQGGF